MSEVDSPVTANERVRSQPNGSASLSLRHQPGAHDIRGAGRDSDTVQALARLHQRTRGASWPE